MPRRLALWLLPLALALCGCATPPPEPVAAAPVPQTYLVRRVIDGDTIEVEDDSGIRTRIRLRNVNAPELGQPGGQEAKDALTAKLLGQRVSLKVYARDKYGRTIAVISAQTSPAESPSR